MRRQVGLKDFEDAAVRDPRVLEITKKIRVVVNPEAHLKVPVIVEIRTKNGNIYISQVEEVIGGPKQPMTREEFLRKFNNCARYAARPVSSEKLEDFLFLADRLETLKDIREVINLFI